VKKDKKRISTCKEWRKIGWRDLRLYFIFCPYTFFLILAAHEFNPFMVEITDGQSLW